jgi:putative FmdB family regulatory protein
MPIYEYVCQACGKQAEIMQKISDPAAKKCPKCGKPKLVKQMSASGFRLGGGGWYETDFKSGNKKNVVDQPEAPAASAKAEGKSDAKPAAKADAKPKAEGKKDSQKATTKHTPKAA